MGTDKIIYRNNIIFFSAVENDVFFNQSNTDLDELDKVNEPVQEPDKSNNETLSFVSDQLEFNVLLLVVLFFQNFG